MNCRGAAPQGAASFFVFWFGESCILAQCCGGALRGYSKGTVRSRAELLEVDCCNGALRGISKGTVRSRAELPEVDCCDGALRVCSKGTIASGTCQLRRSRYRVSVLENYRPWKKDKTTYPHQSADQVIKD